MRALQLVACAVSVAIGGCNQHAPVIDNPVSPTPTVNAPANTPQPGLASIRIDPRGVEAGDGATGVLTLSGPALTPGLFVSLSSSDEGVTVPSTVGIVAGTTLARFAVTTRRFEPDHDRIATISASTPNSNLTTRFESWAIDAPVYFKVFSDLDEPVLGGEFRRFVPGNSTMAATCNRNELRLTIAGPETWSVTFSGGGNQPLYFGTWPILGEDENGVAVSLLQITRNGRSCDAPGGFFTIEDLDLRNNRVNAFHVSFVQDCGDHTGTLNGELRLVNMPNTAGASCLRTP